MLTKISQNLNPLILIADDTNFMRKVLIKILEKAKYRIAVAKSGVDVLNFVKKRNPDLILLDIIMPEMDGIETCKILKSNNNTSDIPIIFITAKIEIDDLLQGFEVGAVDYLKKPFNPLELLARVKTHIELKKAKEEIETLRGIIPICANCKNMRNDQGYWEQIEEYVQNRTEAEFTHSLCPKCVEELYGNEEWFQMEKTS